MANGSSCGMRMMNKVVTTREFFEHIQTNQFSIPKPQSNVIYSIKVQRKTNE